MALWIADGQKGLCTNEAVGLTPPCFALCQAQGRLFAAGQQRGYCLHMETKTPLFDFPLPGGVFDLAPFGEHLCALSMEADCLCAFSPKNGVLCLSAPAGNYPRCLVVSPCGRYAAVAGGAAGEVLVFDRSLHCIRKTKVAGTAVAVCFLPRGLAVLCAAGDQEISARLLSISARNVTEEIFVCPQMPCSLCALPGGGLMMGCHGGLLHINPKGRLLFRTPCTWPARIRCAGQQTLFADSWQGTIRTTQGKELYRGKEPLDFIAN